MKLSKRLSRILDWIDCEVLADIGCDHGYLCAKAIQTGRAKKAYACDVADGPLKQAKRTYETENLQKLMIIRKQDGLQDLPQDVDMVVIAGMGGALIEQFLADWIKDPNFKDKTKVCFLLSAHKDVSHLRKFLSDHHFYIEKETVVKDGHYYPLLKVSYKPSLPIQNLLPEEIQFGFNLPDIQEVNDYLRHEQMKWLNILHSLPEDKQAEAKQIINLSLKLLDQRKELQSKSNA